MDAAYPYMRELNIVKEIIKSNQIGAPSARLANKGRAFYFHGATTLSACRAAGIFLQAGVNYIIACRKIGEIFKRHSLHLKKS